MSKVKNITLDNSYVAEEVRLSTNQQVNLRNMETLKRLAFTPNSESEEFNLATLKNSPDVTITSFNCPKLKEFITTAPQRISYGKSDDVIYPYKLFMANKLDLRGTQVDTVKFLCTTDIFDLKLPNTVKNFYCDSAFDLDTSVITDGDYDVVHGDLIQPYTEEYNENVYLSERATFTDLTITNWVIGKKVTAPYGVEVDDANYKTALFEVIPSTAISFKGDINNGSYFEYDADMNNVYYIGCNQGRTMESRTKYVKVTIPKDKNVTISFTGVNKYTPNIIPTSANGSLIFNINQETPQQNAPYIWNLQGMKLNDFHTYGVNNKVDIDLLGNIKMPKRLADYKVQIKNADITPNQYNTMLYPKLVDTTLPITGKLDYSQYKGKYLSWAFAYTTDAVTRTPLDSRKQGQIINDYNKLYGTDFIDIVDVWAYKDDDFSNRATNNNITKAYIELTQDNHRTRIDEVIQWYPNCTELYLFEDGNVTSLNFMIGTENSNSGNPNARTQIKIIKFMESYFNNVTSAYGMCANNKILEEIYNIPNNITNMGRCFNLCSKLKYISNFPSSMESAFGLISSCSSLINIPDIPNTVNNLEGAFSGSSVNQIIDLSSCNIANNRLNSAFQNCKSLTYTPILPSNYTGNLGEAFRGTKITTAPVLPDGVTTLTNTFRDCPELTTVGNIPSACHVYNSTFFECKKLVSVPEEGWNGDMNSTFGSCSSLNQRIVINSADNLISTFNGCSSLSITPTLPEVVKGIMDSCFHSCSNLVTPPKTPEKVTIMNNSYNGCVSLTTAPEIPNSVTGITNILYKTKVTALALPLDSISNYTNALLECSLLTDITWTGKRKTNLTLISGGLNCPSYTQDDICELVPEHLEDLYKDKIKISFGDNKITINDTEKTITT